MKEKKAQQQAVALEYKHGTDIAPRVVAKGRGDMAEQIIAVAHREGIFIHEDKDLVALMAALDKEELIPTELYRAVGEILVFVYMTRGRFPG